MSNAGFENVNLRKKERILLTWDMMWKCCNLFYDMYLIY